MPRKAIIPVAGLGARLAPWSAAAPKALLPLVDPSGGIRPVIHCILAEARRGGVRSAAVVISPHQRGPLEQYLSAARGAELPAVELIVQETPAGFGDAVAQGRHFAAGEPVLVLLGDHVYLSAPGAAGCVAQVSAAFADRPGSAAVVGVQSVPEEELPRVGVATGERIADRLYRCTDFLEKPDVETARRRLRFPGLGEGRYLAHAGIYAFCPEIFDCIDALDGAGERELADAQSLLLKRRPSDYLLLEIAGEALDTGTPANYAAAFQAWRAG